MKKSNILIVLPVVLILTGLIFYNFKLKELYDTKAYKSRYKDMEFTPIPGIEHLDIQSANARNMNIEYGTKEGIWIYKSYRKIIKRAIKGNVLSLDFIAELEEKNTFWSPGIILVTKNLKSVTTSPGFKDFGNNMSQASISISNYHLDQLDLKIAPHVNMSLSNLKVNTLNAVVGNETQDWAQLALNSTVTVNHASFDVPGKGMLDLSNPKIAKVSYHLSDSASVSLSGKALEVIKR